MVTTTKVLEEVGAGESPRIIALNKMDLVADRVALAGFFATYPDAIPISIKTGEGLETLRAAIEAGLTLGSPELELRVPDTEYAMVALLRREASILGESREDDATVLRVRLPERLVSRFDKYKIG